MRPRRAASSALGLLFLGSMLVSPVDAGISKTIETSAERRVSVFRGWKTAAIFPKLIAGPKAGGSVPLAKPSIKALGRAAELRGLVEVPQADPATLSARSGETFDLRLGREALSGDSAPPQEGLSAKAGLNLSRLRFLKRAPQPRPPNRARRGLSASSKSWAVDVLLRAIRAVQVSAALALVGAPAVAQIQPGGDAGYETGSAGAIGPNRYALDLFGPVGKLDLPLAGPAPAPQTRQKPIVNDRIFWVLPNYHTEENPGPFKPLTPRQKFKLAFDDSFDPPYAQFDHAVFAGISQLQRQYPSWGMGWRGYGDRYLTSFATQAGGNFLSDAIYPTLFREDPRYFRLGHGGFWHRSGYAISRVFLTRTDSGSTRFNYSGMLGNATMTAASNIYVPSHDRTVNNAAANFSIQIGMNAAGNMLNEFWPDVKRFLTGQ